MLWHLVAAAFAGLGSAGVALLLRKLSCGRLPKWLVPVAAGLGMLGYQVYYEYTWAEHRLAQLPAEAQLVESSATPAFWRPWTHLFPMTTAFTVIDTSSIARNHIDGDKVVRFMAYHFERDAIERMHHRGYLLNCTTGERVPLNEQGQPLPEQLQRLPASSDWWRYLCQAALPNSH